MAAPTSEIWLVRHGATAWSESGQHTSTTDLPLLPEGEEVARGLRERLAGVAFDHVVTSPLQRASRTAELAGFPDAEVDPDLVEWAYGDYEGLTTAQIREQVPGWELWTHPSPGGETAAEVGERLDRVIARARERGGRTLVFGHGHASRVLAARWVGLEVAHGGIFRLGTATISELGWKRELPVVVRWNA